MPKKTNPRRIPATQADVSKARKEAVEVTTEISMFVLAEYFDFDEDMLIRYWDEMTRMANDLHSGTVKRNDLRGTLREEYRIEVLK